QLKKQYENFLTMAGRTELFPIDREAVSESVIRIAFENHLLGDCEAWLSYANARVDTSHDYSGDKAAAALTLIGPFIAGAEALYCRMTGEARFD
ncbi:MAG: nucleotidyltransferase substrate binding protein, partial [Spirochaetaceae bacterium]|nr:nucleotidyltransferase substrate binding protein [Spirochaetaceae bacterium]